ncbi:MAG: redoxin domain-containing protein [candidate division Zixibacteria bacterium]|nr:redoxin domain-containing protein [candidate division Zixibacteria bacterium]
MRRLFGYISYRCFAALLGLLSAFPAQAQRPAPQIPQEQLEALRPILQTKDPRTQSDALDRFLVLYPDTPLKADVYRGQFESRKAFLTDHELLWATGERYAKEVEMLIDNLPPYVGNPALAQVYNEIAYEFALRGQRLDDALARVQQALSCIAAAVEMPPPNLSSDVWKTQLNDLHGQTLDTMGWVQFKRHALADAAKASGDALEKLPSHGSLHYHAGMIHTALGNEKNAIDAYLSALAADRPDSAALPELARIFEKKYGPTAKMQFDTQMAAAHTRAKARRMREAVSERLNRKAPDFSMKTLSGTTTSLNDLKGKVVIVNFWATWCPPCREEMPALENIWQTYQNNPNVAFLIASVDQERRLVKPYIDEHGYTFPVYYAGVSAMHYQVVSIPTTYVIDRTGTVQFVHVGYRPDIAEVIGWQIETLKEE